MTKSESPTSDDNLVSLDDYRDRENGIDSEDELISGHAEAESAIVKIRLIEARLIEAGVLNAPEEE